jgi:hypothetical protein
VLTALPWADLPKAAFGATAGRHDAAISGQNGAAGVPREEMRVS